MSQKYFGPKKAGLRVNHNRPDPEPRKIFVFASSYSLNSDLRKTLSKLKQLHEPKNFRAEKSGAPSQIIVDLTRSPAKFLFSHQVIL